MIVWGWWTRGAAAADVAQPQGPEWVWRARGASFRAFSPRVRDDYWVEFGHNETDDPATDTRED